MEKVKDWLEEKKEEVEEVYNEKYLPKKKKVQRPFKKADQHGVVKLIRALMAEFYGTVVLNIVLIVGNVIQELNPTAVVQIQPILCVGFALSALIYSVAEQSGGHYNPAVSWAFFLRGVFPFWKMVLYWVVQHGGAVVAAGLCYGIFGYTNLGVTIPKHISHAEAYYMESLLGFFFFSTILFVSKRFETVGPQAALAVGLCLIASKGAVAELTGGSFNPVTSLGPAVWKGGESRQVLWIYYAASFTASTLAALLAIAFKFIPPAAARQASEGKSGCGGGSGEDGDDDEEEEGGGGDGEEDDDDDEEEDEGDEDKGEDDDEEEGL